jgi:hypothetical protein
MSAKALSTAVRCTILSTILSGCQHVGEPYREIDLDRFSDSNYSHLNPSLGDFVCIRGKLVVSSMGLHFPLKPVEEEGVLSPGYSRIVTGLSYDYALRNRIVDGGNYRVCGILRDATPFPNCSRDDCRWYELGNAELR